MVAGGELEAAEKTRVLSDGGSGEIQAAWMVAGGSPGDGGPSGALGDDTAVTTAAQIEV